VDSGCSQHLTATTAGLVEVTSCGGEVETAAAGQSLSIVGRGTRPGVPGTTYVVENLSEDLVSFHSLEEKGLVYRRHPAEKELREWTRNGTVVPSLTFKVYSNNMGVLHT